MEVWLNKNTSPTFWVVFGTSHLNQHCIYNEGISLAKIHRGKCISTKSPWFLATCWLFHRAYQRWREKGAGRTNRYSLMCAIQFSVLLNQQFWSKHNVSQTWKTLPDLGASLYKLPFELRSVSSKLELSNVTKDISFTKSEPISWCLKSQPTAPMLFFTWNQNSDTFPNLGYFVFQKTSWLQVCSHYTHPFGFNSQPGSWPADQSSAGLRSVVRSLPRWPDRPPWN